jgi:two-component system KDP operon response regulator KdpE
LKNVATAANPAIAPTRRIRVLIAFDDPGYRARLTTILQALDYVVEEADSRQTQDSVQSSAFDLIILGIKRRGSEQVIEVCRQVRALAPRSGIVLFSLGDSNDGARGDRRADGLEAGADDYITANVESREFLARIRAVLRRIHPAESFAQIMRAGDLEIDISRRYARQNGAPIHLTRTEFDLLALIMQKPGTSFTHAQLLRSVWGPEYGSELEYLRAYIRLLRRKIDIDPAKPSYIRTVPGVGYCFQGPFDL